MTNKMKNIPESPLVQINESHDWTERNLFEGAIVFGAKGSGKAADMAPSQTENSNPG